jgi:hypothetical protein
MLFAILLLAGLIGCKNTSTTEGDALAVSGSRHLTRSEVEVMAGLPYDSLTNEERWSLINRWIESAVVLQEGEQRGLDKDLGINMRLEDIRAELYLSALLQELEEITPTDSEISAYYADHQKEFVQTVDSYRLELYRASDCDPLKVFIAEFKPETSLDGSGVILEQRWLARTDQMNGFLQTLLAGLKSGDWTEAQQDPDGCRALRVVNIYNAGETLDLEGARSEIEMQLTIDSNHRQRDEMMSDLRRRYPVTILVEDSL